MNKKEFLNILFEILSEEIGSGNAKKHVAYYDEYITMNAINGKKEEDVIKELGSPRLIAKSIIEAGDSININYSNDSRYEDYSDEYANSESTNSGSKGTFYYKRAYHNDIEGNSFFQKIKLYAKIALVLLVLFLILGAVFGVIITVIKIIFKLIVPIAIIYGLIWIYEEMRK